MPGACCTRGLSRPMGVTVTPSYSNLTQDCCGNSLREEALQSYYYCIEVQSFAVICKKPGLLQILSLLRSPEGCGDYIEQLNVSPNSQNKIAGIPSPV
ncbi:hypothetical protein V1294_006343 [Bradyrhizobium sp. AZCC 1678]